MEVLNNSLNREILLKHEIERVAKIFTKQEIADFAGVLKDEVCRFEKGESLEEPVVRKLTDAYHYLDARGFLILSPYK